MHLKRNKESLEINDLELIEKFLVSEYFKNRFLDLDTRLALFIAGPEPKGLNSTFLGEEFNRVVDMLRLELQREEKILTL